MLSDVRLGNMLTRYDDRFDLHTWGEIGNLLGVSRQTAKRWLEKSLDKENPAEHMPVYRFEYSSEVIASSDEIADWYAENFYRLHK